MKRTVKTASPEDELFDKMDAARQSHMPALLVAAECIENLRDPELNAATRRERALYYLAQVDTKGAVVDDLLKQIAAAAGDHWTARNETKWRSHLLAKQREIAAASAGGGDAADCEAPADGADCEVIYEHWPASERRRLLKERIKATNDKRPLLFSRTDGLVRIRPAVDVDLGRKFEDLAGREQWAFEINKRVTFKQRNLEKGTEKELGAPEWAITHMKGGAAAEVLPYLERVVNVPVFAPDGTLMTAPGYHPAAHIYLDPPKGMTFRPLPDVITEEHVRWAFLQLYEALRDFPFSDAFDGDEPLPVRSGDADADGKPLPTYERGQSSRAHVYAMLLQPFVRSMIVGPCPAYFIDKSAPGTGAGLLMDVLTYILTGQSAPVQTLQKSAHSEEEFSKRVTAMLRGGSDVVFFDNINFAVDSGTLAAALTAGNWTGRILGKSEDVTLPIRCVWTFAGNNVEFSRELLRRLVPIRMDAATPDPANDRPMSFYVHYPLNEWLLAHRVELIHACHILVANWVHRGRVPYTDGALQSFSSWSNVMGGILRDASIPGFLASLAAFNDVRGEEAHGTEVVMEAVYREFNIAPWTVLECGRALSGNALTGSPLDDVGLDTSDERRLATSFGRWLRKNADGRTFKLGERHYKVAKVRGDTASRWRLMPVQSAAGSPVDDNAGAVSDIGHPAN